MKNGLEVMHGPVARVAPGLVHEDLPAHFFAVYKGDGRRGRQLTCNLTQVYTYSSTVHWATDEAWLRRGALHIYIMTVHVRQASAANHDRSTRACAAVI